jgi:hypothetical protein
VVTLKVADDFWQLLKEKVPDERDFDSSDKEALIAKTLLGYFLALRWHQDTLLRALKLVTESEKARLDVYMKDRYPNTHARAFAVLRDDALEMERWPPWAESTVFKETDGFDLDVERMRTVLDAVRADREAEHRLQIEEAIYQNIDFVVDVVRERLKGRDILTVEDVWPVLKDSLYDLKGPADEAAAKEILQAVLADVHRARAAELFGEAEGAIAEADTKGAADRARRIQKLIDQLNAPVGPASPDAILDLARGQTTHLVAVFVMAQTSLVVGADFMETDTPGRVVRAANLLRLALTQGSATLGEAYDWLMAAHERRDLWMMMYDPEKQKQVLKDSDLGFFDRLEMGPGTLASSVGTVGLADQGIELLRKSRRSGALKFLIDAENAGGGDKRKEALAILAEHMRKQSPSHSKAVAMWIYSYLLDAVDELATAGEQLKKIKADAEDARKKQEARKEEDKKRPAGQEKTAAEVREEAEWADAIAREQKLAEKAKWQPGATPAKSGEEIVLERERETNVIEEFSAERHPIHKRPLNVLEVAWWKAWLEISGEDSFWPGEKGWAEVKEFGAELLKMAAIGFVTGGLGTMVRGALMLEMTAEAGVTLSGVLLTTGEVALFTQINRMVNEMQTGQRSQASFLEELGVNLLMAGASKYAFLRTMRALELRGVDPRSLRGRLNLFVAEYVATSGVGLAYLHLGTFIHGGVVTSEDIKHSLKHNFAFLVGMKTIHAGVHSPRQRYENEKKTHKDKKVAAAYEKLLSDVAAHDKAIEAQLAAIKDAKTPEERQKAFEQAARSLEEKAKVIEKSGIPEAAKEARDLRTMISVATADFGQAIVLERVGARPLESGDTPHLAYDKGTANEAALERHFNETGANFTFTERADGSRVYTVTTTQGPLRYEPRDPATMGAGTQREATPPPAGSRARWSPGSRARTPTGSRMARTWRTS